MVADPATWRDGAGNPVHSCWRDSATKRKALHHLRSCRRTAQLRAWIAQARPGSFDAAFSLAALERADHARQEAEA
eukprot:15478492-Alexandrium_andersonii.AAC.1